MGCNLKTKVHRKFNSGESVHLRCSLQTDGLEATKKTLSRKMDATVSRAAYRVNHLDDISSC